MVYKIDTTANLFLFSSTRQVALLDYGQVKDFPDALRLAYANLVVAMANNDPNAAKESFRLALLIFG